MPVKPHTTTVHTPDVRFQVMQAGPPDGPPVLLLHGFPELAYSWRHQLTALAAAGYRAIAPDMRGLGGTSAPADVEAYDVLALTGDVLALMDALEIQRAALIGHDWGADVAWKTAWIHPERVTAVAALSVPYIPRAPAPPLAIMRKHIGEDFYIVWFQQPGVADAALARDVRRTVTTREVWTAEWAARHDEPPTPPWLTEDDVAFYVEAYERTGFTGGINWYRNIDRNWRLTEPYAERRIEQPALFITGSRDPVRRFMPAEAMTGHVTDLRDVIVVDGAGHWVMQERPDEVNTALLTFLGALGT